MSCKITVKVVPGSARDSVQVFGGGLKVKVSAPPEKGQANKALISILASALGLKQDQVSILNGHTSQLKTVELQGIELSSVLMKIDSN